ncbi:hypothetical protein CONPUDRAFT_149205 [Coniophora puteana RWD-64-598 SS2]|uniref:Conidiation protein 6 n=1 Tax=Coniophora puteana (strain RWD-64-598) TaxID=741705 RepID=A0A5M3N6V9_CONPW|nr:uncharacterized protein CONPUDRAFT_149205 [Coniophora puteana RWD-64-598 SS2]EIW87172.1 hypothetical protein CONPUDRAFT_149205 [Coniophora puteana RWD-64-598 SS2]
MANPGNIAGGHKATLANPNISEGAKQNSQKVLDQMEGEGQLPEQSQDVEGKNMGNVIGGHKATLKNPNISEEAKERSKQALDDLQNE